MPPLTTSITCVLLLACVFYTDSALLDCTPENQPTLSLSTSLMDLKVTGPESLITPKKSNGELFEKTSIKITLLSLEQMGSPPGQKAVSIKRMDFADCLCYTAIQRDALVSSEIERGAVHTISPPNATRDQITVFLTGRGDFQNTTMNMTFSASPLPYNVTYHDVSNTQGIPLEYSANIIKFTYSTENWPWDKSEPNSYLLVTFLGNLKMDSTFRLLNTENDFSTDMILEAEQSEIRLKLERGAVIDGVPFRDDRGTAEPSESNSTNTGTIWTFDVDFRFYNYCTARDGPDTPPSFSSTTGFYNYISYDPTFSVLFTGSDPIDQTTPKSKQDRKVIVGATVGTILGVLLLAGIFAVLVMKIPSLKYAIFPHRKRHEAPRAKARDVGMDVAVPLSESSRPSSWNSYKPS